MDISPAMSPTQYVMDNCTRDVHSVSAPAVRAHTRQTNTSCSAFGSCSFSHQRHGYKVSGIIYVVNYISQNAL